VTQPAFDNPRDEAERLRDLWAQANEGLALATPGTEEWTDAQRIERQAFAEYVRGQFET
jgi:hypothetical protein